MLSTLKEKKIHQRQVNVLLTIVYKYLNSLYTELMNEVFYLRQNQYNLRNLNAFDTDNSRNKFMINSTVYRANQLWKALLSKVKGCPSLQVFKNKIKTWRCDTCECQICSKHLSNLSYFQLYSCSVIVSFQNCAVATWKWLKCYFVGKTMNLSPCILSEYLLRHNLCCSYLNCIRHKINIITLLTSNAFNDITEITDITNIIEIMRITDTMYIAMHALQILPILLKLPVLLKLPILLKLSVLLIYITLPALLIILILLK